MKTKYTLPLALAAIISAPVQAATFVWHDTSYEALLNSVGSPASDVSLAVNDILIGVVTIESFNPNSVVAGGQLTGIFASQVTSIAANTATNCNGGGSLSSCSSFTFGAVNSASGYANFAAAVAAYETSLGIAAPVLSNVGANTVATFFLDPTPSAPSGSASQSAAVTDAIDGTQILTLGLNTGDFWTGQGPTDITEPFFDNLIPGSQIGSFGIQASITYQNVPGYVFNPLMSAIGTIGYTGESNPATAFLVSDQTNFTFTGTAIPEPSILALMGIGFLGIGAAKRRAA